MRVLFLTHRLPYAANRGDRLRALHILRLLKSRGEVDLVSFVHNRDEEERVADLATSANSVTAVRLSRLRGYTRALAALGTGHPLTHAILDAQELRTVCAQLIARHPPDIVLAYCSGMARFALEEPLKSIPFVLDMVDVDSEKWRALGKTGTAPARWIYAAEGRGLSAFERRAAQAARAVVVVNERERVALKRLAPTANVQVVQNGVDLTDLCPHEGPSAHLRVTFCGVMNYRPNEQGVLWFAKAAWPLVREQRPAARLSLVGSDPTEAVRDLVGADPTIQVTGTVPDVRPYLWRSAVGIAPIFVARGVQNKVLEAVAAGLPCVITPEVQEGLPPEVLPACMVASDASTFAVAIVTLLDMTPGERRAIAARASLGLLTWTDRLGPLASILDGALT
jgi:sugar transferase (PEP-CTERM/EpsH1 system associated)